MAFGNTLVRMPNAVSYSVPIRGTTTSSTERAAVCVTEVSAEYCVVAILAENKDVPSVRRSPVLPVRSPADCFMPSSWNALKFRLTLLACLNLCLRLAHEATGATQRYF